MSKPSATSSGRVPLLLKEAVRQGRQTFEPNTVQQFEVVDADRLIKLGAAVTPPAPLVPPAPVTERVVTALSEAGSKFQKLTNAKKAAEFVLEAKDAATVAEFQALEFRREDGPRAEVVEALKLAFSALAEPAKD